jgi:predicted transcriptional regulator
MADFVQYSRQVKYTKKTVNQLKEKLTKKGQTFPVKKNKEYYIQLLLDLSSSEDEIEQDENQQVIKPKKETKIKEPKEEKTIDFEKFNNELESIYENFKETKEDKNKKNLFKKEIMTSLKQNDIFKGFFLLLNDKKYYL